MTPKPLHDDELLRLIKAGNEDAFLELYRRRQGGIYRFALQMSGSQAIAEDVTQEVFMALIHEAEAFDPQRGSLSAYLYGIARNQVLRSLRRDKPYISLGENDEADDFGDERLVAVDDPLRDLTRNETIGAVRQAILALPAHYREVVVLCDLHEMSYAEAAEVLGCAVGTIRSRLHRARGILVEKLKPFNAISTTPGDATPARCFI